MKTNRLYDDLAYLWPLVSPPEDYAEEAGDWRDALRSKLGPGRHEILELGVGGGHNLSHLTGEFHATAADLSEKMVQHSIRLNPGVEHFIGDMRTIRLGKRFMAVIIHDAVSYMLTEQDLRETFITAGAHLDEGGVFITAPDYFRETFHGPVVDHSTHSDGETELTFIEYVHDPDPGDTTIETIMFYIIKKNGELSIEQDRHVTGLFPLKTWKCLMAEAGFKVEEWPCPPGRDPRQSALLIGTKTPGPV